MIRDESVIDLLKGDNTLLDAQLVGVSVAQQASRKASVDLVFRGRVGSEFSEIRLQFIEVIAYEISYEEDDAPLDIWELKLMKLADGAFYISLDPDPSTLPAAGVREVRASDTDNFFVRSRHLEAIVTRSSVPGSV